MSTDLVFIKHPSLRCGWVIHPLLMVGEDPAHDGIEIGISISDVDLIELIHNISCLLSSNTKVYIHFIQNSDILVLLTCFLQSWFRWDRKRSECYAKSCLKFSPNMTELTTKQQNQILRYKRPLIVLMCGDRDSAICFEEMINFELKILPKYSVIIHGGCKGIDLYVAELARLHDFETREYPAEWSVYGNSAGPIRNQKMLDEERPDVVIAFHPDISASRGTKNMMTLAWKAEIPVYIHDFKRKMKFEGDFDVL